MYVKIEPTGCCERKGMVQVRLAMYLDPEDYGYEKHRVQVPVFPEGGYTGKKDELGQPVSVEGYKAWVKGLPTVLQNNPFHNHFIYVEPDTSDEEIMDIAEAFLHEAYIKWAQDLKLDLTNDALPFSKPESVDEIRKIECNLRVNSIASSDLSRSIS